MLWSINMPILWNLWRWVSCCPLSHVQLFATPRNAAHQTFLSFTISRSLVKLMSIESVMPSNCLILLLPSSPPALNLCQHQGLFQWVTSLYQVAKVLEFQLQHQSFLNVPAWLISCFPHRGWLSTCWFLLYLFIHLLCSLCVT